MPKYFLNLTNGIEALQKEKLYNKNIGFIRIQSTACEQKRWEYILNELDYDFLMNLAIGTECVIVDYSAKKTIPRSIYQGLEWIKYVLYRVWNGYGNLNYKFQPIVNDNNVEQYFNEQYKQLSKNTLKKIKYFRKFINPNMSILNIRVITGQTTLDGNYDKYREILYSYM